LDQVRGNILETIGATPLVRLNRMADGLKGEMPAKLESASPGGSVKDRIAVKMIEAAEARGLIRPGGVIVEAAAGNTGVAERRAPAAPPLSCAGRGW
jgi:cystathionine beta-synthase